jgi:hypothetical protein
MTRSRFIVTTLGAIVLTLAAVLAHASSHREAPFITEIPKVDGTDFYMFNSYEAGRTGFVTLIANYQPLQDAYGGPNYFSLDPDALYEIHIDNNGDAVEDITFQFQFQNVRQDLSLMIGGESVAVPLVNIGPVGPGVMDTASLNVIESYTINMVLGDRRTGTSQAVTNADTGDATFIKPLDNVGNKSIADYATYAANHIYNLTIPNCNGGRVFVGQRDDPFVVNLGEVFDLVNLNPLGEVDAESDIIADKNITSFILEVPASCLTASGGSTVIGGWTTASMRQTRVLNPLPSSDPTQDGAAIEGGAWTQVSRLSGPLVNEVVIGLKDKDRFNASEPADDAQFATYVTNPTLPAILEILFPVTAPTSFPRADLVQIFLSGIPGLNMTSPALAEMIRLDTSTPPVPAAMQNNLGVIAGDTAGYPNGRRPGDDVVDIALRAVMGVLLPIADAPSGDLPFTDGAVVNATMFDDTFPYIQTPYPGSPTP